MLRGWLLGLGLFAGMGVVGYAVIRQPPVSPQAVMQRQAERLSRAPLEARQAYSAGLAACEAKQYGDGVRALQQAAEQAPSIALIHHNLGVAFAGAGRPEEALREFRTALQLEPALAPSHLHLGLLYVESQDYGAAETSLSEALRLDPELEQARLLQSHVALMRGDALRAEALAREAVRRNPESFNATMALGDVLARSPAPGASTAAVEALRQAGRLSNPRTDPEGLAFRRLGEVSLRVNQRREAVSALEKAVKLAPNDPSGWHLLERAYRLDRQLPKATFAGRRARQVLEWARAVKSLRERIPESPGDAQLYFRLAAVERRRGNRSAAIAAYRDGLARDPDAAAERQALAALERAPGLAP